MKKLDPKAVWLFYFSQSFIVFWLVWIFGYSIAVGISQTSGTPSFILLIVDNWWLVLISISILNFVWAHLSWNFYRYELTNDGFRKEEGVIWKKYVTIPYERIQNVDVYRGPLARVLGLSDLQIQTAGMSAAIGRYGTRGVEAEGRLPGISREEAEKLRNELIKRSKGKKDQSL